MILFLDFDGVLHPSPNKISTEFSALPLFEDWLRMHEQVNVVISSSWRDVMDIDKLKAIFSTDLQDRIIDKCPMLPFDKMEVEVHWRYKEIKAWIESNNYQGPWVALDDAVNAFPEKHPQLVACKQAKGLTPLVIERLTSKVLESGQNMINVFFDTEFTHLPGPLDLEPPSLISIGCVSQNDTRFYAENADFQVELCSDFTTEAVLPFLEGGDVSMPYQMIAKLLKEYIEEFTSNVTMWCDSPYHDWPFIQDLFDNWGWPRNLAKKPACHSKDFDFNTGVEQAFNTFEPKLRRHHALDDAIANRHGFLAQNMGTQLTSK